ncbi:MAG: IgGFc-binding protein, partial [Polyangiaceae bacterium]|nr:IgGFc-binding protein [Polyangiaceae bacterium]
MHKHINPWQIPLFAIAVFAITCAPSGGAAPSGPGNGGSSGNGDGGPGENTSPPKTCTPNKWGCYGNTRYQCSADGQSRHSETVCPSACDPSLGCVFCKPGSHSCQGQVSSVCTSDGNSFTSMRDCAEWGSVCGHNGFCSDVCGEAESSASNIGCEYWPTPLANDDNLHGAFDYRVVVGNPTDKQARVTVTRGSSTAWEGYVPVQGLVEIKLPWVNGQSKGLQTADETNTKDWRSIVVENGAYRLVSDRPVTVSQFNPFEYQNNAAKHPDDNPNGNSFTNDASLLLPTHVLTGDYVNVTYVPLSVTLVGTKDYAMFSGSGKSANYLAVVGVSPEPTNVHIQVSAHTAGDMNGRWGPTGPGGWIHFTLHRGEVAHVASAVPPNCNGGRPGYSQYNSQNDSYGTATWYSCYEPDFDLTGSRVFAERPVQAFGGHVCAFVPHAFPACDHLEVQLPPIQSWGTKYVGQPMADGNVQANNIVRVIGAFDETNVTVDPPQYGGFANAKVQPNQFIEFVAVSAFTITATNAVMVAQFMLGQNYYPNPTQVRGDPAITVLVPSEQYRKDYVFVAPSSYNPQTNGQSYLLITRQPGANLTLNGGPVNASWNFAGGWELATIPINGGTHSIVGSSEFGAIVFGVGSYTSYV